MKKQMTVHAFATVALTVAFPLVASASSVAQERAFERLNQPVASQSRQENATNDRPEASPADIGGGQSEAMSDALRRDQEAENTAARADTDRRSVRDWSGQSKAAAGALRRVNQEGAS